MKSILWLVLMTLTASFAQAGDNSLKRDDPAMMEKRTNKAVSFERVDVKKGLTAETAAPMSSEVKLPPPLRKRIEDDLEKRNGQNVELVSSEKVTWPNGAMGCPQPGVSYLQVQVSGYRVLYRGAGRIWDYRISDKGSLMLCERSTSVKPTDPLPVK